MSRKLARNGVYVAVRFLHPRAIALSLAIACDPATTVDEPARGSRDRADPQPNAERTDDERSTAESERAQDVREAADEDADDETLFDERWCAFKAVLDRHCTSCHDGTGTAGAPMGLTRYEDLIASSTREPAERVYERVGVRVHREPAAAEGLALMPPRGALTAAELASVDAWIAADAPAPIGDASCTTARVPDEGARAPASFPPPECDEVYRIVAHGPGGPSEPYLVQPGGEYHPQMIVDAPWGDETVQAIAFRPITDNTKVLHHWILYSNQNAFLVGWAPGDEERPLMPPDVGMEMPRGPASMRLDVHYFNTAGSAVEQDQSGLEVCVLREEHFRKHSAGVMMGFTVMAPIMAPAGQLNHEATSDCQVQTSEPVHLLTTEPHAHTHAVHMKFTVKKPDGTQIVMHDRPFTFGEQATYPLEQEVILNTGDVVTTTCVYSNPTNRDIPLGVNAEDEMCYNFAIYYPKGALSCGLVADLLVDLSVFVTSF